MYLSLGGVHITNNSKVSIHGIGEGDSGALLCVTDLRQCCHKTYTATGRALGWWYYPNGTHVPIFGDDYFSTLYRNRGPRIVRLNRRNDAEYYATGLYCCEVPNSTFITHRVCANNIKYYWWVCACIKFC